MKLKVYLETSVISAYFDSRTPERMAQTHSFWKLLHNFNPVISQHVMDELTGIIDEEISPKIHELIKNLAIIDETSDSANLANEYIARGIFPKKYFDDALHLAIATSKGCHILVSWNFRHLVKRKTRFEANLINSQLGYSNIEIIAPPEL